MRREQASEGPKAGLSEFSGGCGREKGGLGRSKAGGVCGGSAVSLGVGERSKVRGRFWRELGQQAGKMAAQTAGEGCHLGAVARASGAASRLAARNAVPWANAGQRAGRRGRLRGRSARRWRVGSGCRPGAKLWRRWPSQTRANDPTPGASEWRCGFRHTTAARAGGPRWDR